MTMLTDLADLFADTLTVQVGTLDGFGKFTPSGATVSYDCHIEGRARLVRNAQGQEVVSSTQVYLDEAPGLTVKTHRYQLPARFPSSPDSSGWIAIGIEKEADEAGAHHEVVLLP